MVRREKSKSFSESAVSEVIGYILIFGIMTAGIALVTLYGYPLLLQEQQSTNIRNMERNMIVLQNDLKGLTYKNVPFKETSLQVAGGTLSIQPEPGVGNGLKSRFIVEVNGSPIATYLPGEIHYDSQDLEATISLENGAVNLIYWDSPDGSVMISEPRWFYDEPTKTFVMSFIKMNASDSLSQTGIGSVRMKIIPSIQSPPIDVSTSTVTIKYKADPELNYKVAWRNYFSGPTLEDVMIKIDPPSAGYDLEYNLDSTKVKTLVIKTYNVTVLSL